MQKNSILFRIPEDYDEILTNPYLRRTYLNALIQRKRIIVSDDNDWIQRDERTRRKFRYALRNIIFPEGLYYESWSPTNEDEEPFQNMNEDERMERNEDEEPLQNMNEDEEMDINEGPPQIMDMYYQMQINEDIGSQYIGYALGDLIADFLSNLHIVFQLFICCIITQIIIPIMRKFDFITVCADSILRSLLVFYKCNKLCDALAVLALDLIMVNVVYNAQELPLHLILTILVYLEMDIITDSAYNTLCKIMEFSIVLLLNAPHVVIIWISCAKVGYHLFSHNRPRTIMDVVVILLYFFACSFFLMHKGMLSLVSLFVGTIISILYKTLMSLVSNYLISLLVTYLFSKKDGILSLASMFVRAIACILCNTVMALLLDEHLFAVI